MHLHQKGQPSEYSLLFENCEPIALAEDTGKQHYSYWQTSNVIESYHLLILSKFIQVLIPHLKIIFKMKLFVIDILVVASVTG